MKLKLFHKIDDTITLLKQNHEEYESIQKEIKYTLLSALQDDSVLDITTRIKTATSLREKIIRNQYYLRYETPQAILNNLSDVIGLKIDCRFIQEEFQIYDCLKKKFVKAYEDGIHEGYYMNDEFPHIAMELETPQPQSQKNGFYIYRIDGYYDNSYTKIHFELQIKSLVNTFWGDIEHKLVYKNTNFNMYDNFMREMLTSIKANLTIIDRQLLAINNAMHSTTKLSRTSMDFIVFEDLISKAINDVCVEKLTNSIGFSLNIKETSKILGNYIFQKNFEYSDNNNQITALLAIFSRLNQKDLDFENAIEMNADLLYEDDFIETLGKDLLARMNVDYNWFVFFRILFALEPDENEEDFLLFLKVYKSNIIDDNVFETYFCELSQPDQESIRSQLLHMSATALIEVGDIKIAHNKYLPTVKEALHDFLLELHTRVMSAKDFEQYAKAYQDELNSVIHTVFQG
ncbi:MAG: RelA/spoT family protein [Breznakia sp.]